MQVDRAGADALAKMDMKGLVSVLHGPPASKVILTDIFLLQSLLAEMCVSLETFIISGKITETYF